MARRNRHPSRPDAIFRWALRVAGLITLFSLLVAFVVLGREVNTGWLFLVAGLLGLDGLADILGAGGER